MMPKEPRFIIIDLHKRQAVPATTDEMQALTWRWQKENRGGAKMVQKQAQQTIPCQHCNGTMCAMQSERGPFYQCGKCGHEIPLIERGTVDE